MWKNIGQVIKEVRTSFRISQSQLAKDICTQALISKIEKGETIPSLEIGYKISKKLHIPLDFLCKIIQYQNFSYIKELNYQIKCLSRERNYTDIYYLIKKEKKNPNYNDPLLKQLLLWQEGVTTYYLTKDFEASIHLLNESLKITAFSEIHSEREIEILNSLANLYFEEGQYAPSLEIFNHIHENIKKNAFFQDYTIQIKVFYNHAKVLTRLHQYDKSNQLCRKGIKICKAHESSYLLGELHYHVGYNYSCLDLRDKALSEYETALHLFKLTDFHSFFEHTQTQILKLKERGTNIMKYN